jgi:hypothetical protein
VTKERPVYLGDGVYASRVDGMIKLTTEGNRDDPVRPNVIYLGAQVYMALVIWARSVEFP